MKNSTRSVLASRLVRAIVISIAGVSTAIACGWSFWTDHSVRFNSERTGRGFYRLPPLPISFNPATGKEETVDEGENFDEFDSSYEAQQAAYAEPGKVWEKVLAASESTDRASLEKLLTEYLQRTKYANTDDSGAQGGRRNVATDILDVFSELDKGSSSESVLAYVKARIADLEHVPDAEQLIPDKVSDQNLKDNWEYFRAARLYNSAKKDDALAAFQDLSKRFPNSEKREAVDYMIGKTILEMSYAARNINCGVEGKGTWGEEIDLSKIEPREKCRDERWLEATEHFNRMLQRYPNGRYKNDVRGWLAFIHKRGDERAEALADYYRLMGQSDSAQWRLEAKKSLQMIGHEYDDATLDKVEALIENEPEAALAYAYHRIYNHAIDFSYAEYNEWCCYGDDKWSQENEERKRVSDEKAKGRHELQRVAKFAATMVKRFGAARVSGEFLLRLSQANLELENFLAAHANAEKAIKRGLSGNSRAEALWVKGSVEHQQKKLDSARETFSRLVAEFPDHKLTEGARRLLAITAEEQGDLEFALDQYIVLNYQYDVAYFVDILFSSEQLAKYLDVRKDSNKYNELRYALGVRYLREGRWQDARDVLRSVKTEPVTNAAYAYEDDRRSPRFPKIPEYSDKPMFVRDTWVIRDISTTYAIEALERTVDQAVGDEAKAEAMYQLASFYYQSSALLLYNPAAWDGARYKLLSDFGGSLNGEASLNDRIVFEHFQSHDTLARAIPIYLEIVDRFPDTKAAKDALYSAAVAHERLSDLNPYWRAIYGTGLFAGPRRVTYDDVRKKYPNYQLPKATYGWEPSTRTVNGGPGWAPKPKPLPKLTTEERVIRKLGKWTKEYGPWVGEKATVVKDSVKGAASSVSDAIVRYLQTYYYLVYFGFIGAIFWQSRKEIYEGPVTKGAFLAHRGLLFLVKRVRQWLDGVAIPSVVRVGGSMKDPQEPPVDSGGA